MYITKNQFKNFAKYAKISYKFLEFSVNTFVNRLKYQADILNVEEIERDLINNAILASREDNYSIVLVYEIIAFRDMFRKAFKGE